MTNTQQSDNVLAEWMQQALNVADADQQAADALNAAGNALRYLYDQATDAGDETALAHISTAWQAAQYKREKIKQMDAVVGASAAVMSELVRQRRDALEELESLTQAIESGDTLDSRLTDFVRTVEEETIIYAEEAVFEQVADNIVDDMRAEITNTLVEATGLSPQSLRPLVQFIFGTFGQLNSVQLGLLKAFIAALNAAEKGAA